MLTRYIKKVCSSKLIEAKTANLMRDMKDMRESKKVYGFSK